MSCIAKQDPSTAALASMQASISTNLESPCCVCAARERAPAGAHATAPGSDGGQGLQGGAYFSHGAFRTVSRPHKQRVAARCQKAHKKVDGDVCRDRHWRWILPDSQHQRTGRACAFPVSPALSGGDATVFHRTAHREHLRPVGLAQGGRGGGGRPFRAAPGSARATSAHTQSVQTKRTRTLTFLPRVGVVLSFPMSKY